MTAITHLSFGIAYFAACMALPVARFDLVIFFSDSYLFICVKAATLVMTTCRVAMVTIFAPSKVVGVTIFA